MLGVQQALDDDAVGAHALDRARSVRAGAIADAQLVLVLAVTAEDDHPRRLPVERDQLPLVARAGGAPRATEVERLEQVRLTGAIGPVHDGQPRPEPRFGASVGAKVAQLDADDAHPQRSTR